MVRWLAAFGCAAGAVLAGCGPGSTPLADGCTGDRDAIFTALTSAPGAVALPDGTPLSRCIADGTDDAELQNVGIAFTQIADALRVRADDGDRAAAVQLGYLIGATRRGARRTNGVMAELVRRVELVGGRLADDRPGATAAALQHGLDAGEARG